MNVLTPSTWAPGGIGIAAEAGAGSPRARRAATRAWRTRSNAKPLMPPSPATRVTPATRCRNDRRAYAGPATGGEALAVPVKIIRASTPTAPAISDGMPSTQRTAGDGGRHAGDSEQRDADHRHRRRRQAIRPEASGEDQQDGGDAAQQDRLVVGAEGPDRELLGRGRGRVDQGRAHGDQRGGDGVEQTGHAVSDADGGQRGHHAGQGSKGSRGLRGDPRGDRRSGQSGGHVLQFAAPGRLDWWSPLGHGYAVPGDLDGSDPAAAAGADGRDRRPRTFAGPAAPDRRPGVDPRRRGHDRLRRGGPAQARAASPRPTSGGRI